MKGPIQNSLGRSYNPTKLGTIAQSVMYLLAIIKAICSSNRWRTMIKSKMHLRLSNKGRAIKDFIVCKKYLKSILDMKKMDYIF